jgi:hypothetical protein
MKVMVATSSSPGQAVDVAPWLFSTDSGFQSETELSAVLGAASISVKNLKLWGARASGIYTKVFHLRSHIRRLGGKLST